MYGISALRPAAFSARRSRLVDQGIGPADQIAAAFGGRAPDIEAGAKGRQERQHKQADDDQERPFRHGPLSLQV